MVWLQPPPSFCPVSGSGSDTSITVGTDSFHMPQFMELSTLTSKLQDYSFAACYCPEVNSCTATDDFVHRWVW